MENKEYLIQSRIKNNLLLKKILADSVSMLQFSKKHKFNYCILMDFVNLKRTVIVNDSICRHVLRLGEILNSEPRDLFPKNQWENAVKTNSISKELTGSEFAHVISLESEMEESSYLIEDSTKDGELKNILTSSMSNLRPIEKKILELRHGFNGHPMTLLEVSHELQGYKHIDGNGNNVVYRATGQERIRQIEARAIKKMQNPRNSKLLREYLDK